MLFSLVTKFRTLIWLIVTGGIFISILEAVGVALFFPLLEGMNPSGEIAAVPYPLNIVNQWFSGYDLAERLRMTAILLVGVVLLKGILVYWNGILAAQLEVDGTNDQITKCYKAMLASRLGYFNSQKGAYYHTIMRQHVGRFGHFLKMIAEVLPAVFTLIVLLGMLITISLPMTILACGFSAFISWMIQKLHRYSLEAGKAIGKAIMNLDATVLDTIQGMKTISLFVRGEDMIKKFQGDIQEWGKQYIRAAKIQSATKPIFEIMSVVGVCILLVVGSVLFVQSAAQTMQLSLLLTFLVVFFRLSAPVAQLNRTRVSLGTILPICHEVTSFLEAIEKEQMNSGTREFSQFINGIEFKGVNFHYDSNRELVLKQVSFHIPKGYKVGVVGPSGAGKSTLAELLLRFYDPQDGEILVDGINLKGFNLNSWRRRIGVVSQDTFLFNDTIKANIRFADPEAEQFKIEQAAKRAHIHDFIMQLPKGYDTLIGDRGVLLSGGQRQRIAIARAILTEPQILVFDEATSALDSESERIVQEALDEISQGKTVIAIAHRLSTVADADVIFVLENGKLVEQGKHQQLLQTQGVYNKLVRMQLLEV